MFAKTLKIKKSYFIHFNEQSSSIKRNHFSNSPQFSHYYKNQYFIRSFKFKWYNYSNNYRYFATNNIKIKEANEIPSILNSIFVYPVTEEPTLIGKVIFTNNTFINFYNLNNIDQNNYQNIKSTLLEKREQLKLLLEECKKLKYKFDNETLEHFLYCCKQLNYISLVFDYYDYVKQIDSLKSVSSLLFHYPDKLILLLLDVIASFPNSILSISVLEIVSIKRIKVDEKTLTRMISSYYQRRNYEPIFEIYQLLKANDYQITQEIYHYLFNTAVALFSNRKSIQFLRYLDTIYQIRGINQLIFNEKNTYRKEILESLLIEIKLNFGDQLKNYALLRYYYTIRNREELLKIVTIMKTNNYELYPLDLIIFQISEHPKLKLTYPQVSKLIEQLKSFSALGIHAYLLLFNLCFENVRLADCLFEQAVSKKEISQKLITAYLKCYRLAGDPIRFLAVIYQIKRNYKLNVNALANILQNVKFCNFSNYFLKTFLFVISSYVDENPSTREYYLNQLPFKDKEYSFLDPNDLRIDISVISPTLFDNYYFQEQINDPGILQSDTYEQYVIRMKEFLFAECLKIIVKHKKDEEDITNILKFFFDRVNPHSFEVVIKDFLFAIPKDDNNFEIPLGAPPSYPKTNNEIHFFVLKVMEELLVDTPPPVLL